MLISGVVVLNDNVLPCTAAGIRAQLTQFDYLRYSPDLAPPEELLEITAFPQIIKS
jgi:hypothetical protein